MGYHDFLVRWGVDIPRPLLRRALTHRSFAYEHDEPHNERLEFIGDSILGMIIAEKVYEEYPDASEGDMSQMKTHAVSEKALAEAARSIHLGDEIRLGKGEEKSGGRTKDSILADTMEAIIAATYMEHGYLTTKKIVGNLLNGKIKEASHLGPGLDWQTSCEELSRKHGGEGVMTFTFTSEGPDHAKVFTAVAHIDNHPWGEGVGSSQKNARHKAAERTYWMMKEKFEPLT